MDYFNKYKKYKSKYLYLKKLIGGGNKYDEILKKIIEFNNLTDDNKYDIYNILGRNNIDKKERYDSINKDINDILDKYYKDDDVIEFKHFKDDMIFVLILDKIAIKIYNINGFDNIRELYEILKKNENPNLEYIYDIIEKDKYVIVVSETLEIDGAKEKITHDDMVEQIINGALKYLHNNGWIHGDANLDNIGYRKGSICNKEFNIECFVLYDFEKSKKIEEINNVNTIYKDFNSIYQSYLLNKK